MFSRTGWNVRIVVLVEPSAIQGRLDSNARYEPHSLHQSRKSNALEPSRAIRMAMTAMTLRLQGSLLRLMRIVFLLFFS